MKSLKNEEDLKETLSATEPLPDQGIYDSISSIGGSAMTLIFEIDLMLASLRRLLLLAQPSIEGRIDLRWWRSRNGGGREPYVFEWARHGNGRWYAKRLSGPGIARYAKRGGPFAVGVEEARAALTQIEKLMQTRQDLLATIGKTRQTLGNKMNGTKMLLSKSGQLMSKIEASAMESKNIREQIHLEKHF